MPELIELDLSKPEDAERYHKHMYALLSAQQLLDKFLPHKQQMLEMGNYSLCDKTSMITIVFADGEGSIYLHPEASSAEFSIDIVEWKALPKYTVK